MDEVKIEFQIDYSEGYVAFIDILGFSALTLKTDRDSRVQLRKCIDVVDGQVSSFKRSRIKVLFVSDSIILSIHRHAPEEADTLIPLCQVVAGIQLNLLRLGLLSRGAISYGEAQIDPKKFRVFGPAYVSAVDLEKRLAIFPRVIIDPSIMREKTRGDLVRAVILEAGTSNERKLLASTEDQYARGTYLKPDHLLFVDYLAEICLRKDAAFLDSLYLLIRDNLAIPSHWIEKYQWLKDYTVASLRGAFDESDFHQNYLDKFGDL